MIEPQQPPLNIPLPAGRTAKQPSGRLISALKFAVVSYVLVMLVLSVETFLSLPANLSLVDFWNMLFLPICWLYLINIRQPLRFPYALGMWFILLGSLIGTFFAYDPLASFIVIMKELYLYVWCITLVAVFASLEPGLLRRIMLVWTAVVVLHGGLLVAEFISPNFYMFMISNLERYGKVFIGRPSGLFENPITAGFFQLMGFVPLLLAGMRRRWTLLLALFLVISILATASLAALSGLVGGSAVAVIVLLLRGGNLKFLAWLATIVTVVAGLFFFTINLAPDVLARLQHLTTQRAEHTARERLGLWGGGTEVLFSPKSILGVGPNNYRDFLENKTLHNDPLEFAVERGVIGLLGLVMLASEALNIAVKILLHQIKFQDTARPSGVIFLAMLVAFLLEGNAQQIFHFRGLWLGLALQGAALVRIMYPSIQEATEQVILRDKGFQLPGKSIPLPDRPGPSPMENQ